MKQVQSNAYVLVETAATPRNNGGTIHTTDGTAELLCRGESAPKIWNQMVDCEARNALQVILSGSEILLDQACRISSIDQKAMLERILASAHHLNSIIATLTRPDDLIGEVFVDGGGPEELHVTGNQRV